MEQERTFQYDDDLPPLPVPPLQQTLQKYLESVEPFLSDSDFQQTKKIVKAFENGVGQTLHNKLVDKAKTNKNWIEEWWEEKAYLEVRDPLPVLQEMTGSIPTQDHIWPAQEGTQVERSAIFLWHILSFFVRIRKEQLPVEKYRAGTRAFSMDQFLKACNACREPGVEKDAIYRYFKTEREGDCPHHVVVMCNGHIFKMEPFGEQNQLLPAQELQKHISIIKEKSTGTRGQGIGSLTADHRSTWAKAFQHLVSLDPENRSHIEVIKSSIIILILDEESPESMEELAGQGVAGPCPYNRWFDKGFGVMMTSNGLNLGFGDHCAADGMFYVSLGTYILQQLYKDDGIFPEQDEKCLVKEAPLPTELIFTIDDKVREDMDHATKTYEDLASKYEVLITTYSTYGADDCKLHPDTTVQLALQLAYYIMHKRPAPAYESAATRQFYHGRTETIRSCTMQTVDWCKAMLDPKATSSRRLELLKIAGDKHQSLMTEAGSGQGIDRHLLGLSIVAQESGLPTPEIFNDKAFTLSGGGGNFVLSTSPLGRIPILGYYTPMVNDGYFITYVLGIEKFHFAVSTFKDCSETNGRDFSDHIASALDKMEQLLDMY